MARIRALPPRISTVASRVRPPAKVPDPFYTSPNWRTFVREIKRQRGYRCEGCGMDCASSPRSLIGDHVVERKDGGADFDPLNVRLLCLGCHNRKTAAARDRRLARPV